MSATAAVPTSITTPDTVESTRLGTLEFRDGAPMPDTAERLYDNPDFMRGCPGVAPTAELGQRYGKVKRRDLLPVEQVNAYCPLALGPRWGSPSATSAAPAAPSRSPAWG
jgi:hypothetical protein